MLFSTSSISVQVLASSHVTLQGQVQNRLTLIDT